MIDWITIHFAALHSWFFETLLQPLLFHMEWMRYEELTYEWSELFLLGAVEIALLWILIRPLEALWPVEHWPDRKAARADVLYTVLSRLGILPIVFFFLLTPAFDYLNGEMRYAGIIPPQLEDYLPASPLLALLAYLLILDFFDYVRHRLEHRVEAWWALHSVHHSQRQMTFWTDEREHLLDHLFAAVWRSVIGLAIGVPAAQFLMISIATGMIESFSHSNVRLSFGRIGERLLVSPHFHRVHHAIGIGHEGKNYGCNFSSIFPVWDVLFGTANFSPVFPQTGISDQLNGRQYGEGFWRQQWLGLLRLTAALRP